MDSALKRAFVSLVAWFTLTGISAFFGWWILNDVEPFARFAFGDWWSIMLVAFLTINLARMYGEILSNKDA